VRFVESGETGGRCFEFVVAGWEIGEAKGAEVFSFAGSFGVGLLVNDFDVSFSNYSAGGVDD